MEFEMDMKEITAINNSNSDEVLDLFGALQVSNQETEISSLYSNIFPPNNILDITDECFFKVKKLAYDKDYPHREAFENVLLSLGNSAFNFVYVLEGYGDSIELYIGVVKNGNSNTGSLNATDYGPNLKKIFEGNFTGIYCVMNRGKRRKKPFLPSELYDIYYDI